MPFEKNAITKIILGLVVAGGSNAANAAGAWDCQQTDRGWSCGASADYKPEPVPLTRISATEDAIEAQITKPLPKPLPEPKKEQEPKNALTAEPEQKPEQKIAAKPAPVKTDAKPEPDTKAVATTATSEATDEPIEAVTLPARAIIRDPSDDRRDINLDWVRLAPLDAEGLVCKGRYDEPDIWVGDLAPGNEESSTVINADESDADLDGLSILRGNVIIEESGRQIKSNLAEFEAQSRQALLRGDVRYREPNLLMTADAMSADLNNKIAIANEARFVMHDQHMRGDAESMTRFGDQRVEAEDTLITYCEPGNNDWGIRAAQMELYPQEGYGEAWNTRFEVAGVPVFYLPYFYWPLNDTRRTGLLYPSLSTSEQDGYDLALPYYFNIAPNIDDTLTTRIIEQRGVLFENEARYLNSFSMNTLNTSWLPDDDLQGSERWLIDFNHTGTPAPNWSSDVSFTRVSDDNYFDDLTPVTLAVPAADVLSQRAQVAYSGNGWSASALVNDYQILDNSTSYKRMPQLNFSTSQSLNETVLNLAVQYTQFDSTNESATDGSRLHARQSIGYSAETTWGYLRPEAGVWHSSYDFSDNSSASHTNLFASLDSGLIFERQGEIATQTLEPRIKLIHVDGDNTNTLIDGDNSFFDSGKNPLGFSYGNLFDNLGHSGNDRVSHTDQATLGLESKVYSLTGRELISAGIAQAHYFGDHDARPGDSTGTADQSDYAVYASWKPSEVLTLSHDSRIDRETAALLTENYRAYYRPDDERLLYANLRKTQSSDGNNTFNQIDLATRWPITTEWSGVARYTQDIKESENLETLAGIEYENCCWKVRFTGQRSIVDGSSDFERENKFYIQFILRGLGAFGQSEGRQFLEDLTGYNEDDRDNF
ncbi:MULTISPECIES: LPS-assembly protein LptD [unclassified Marinobacterium]|uniref:LPS-assembly protein LptD n=1 Tax=unclassified Marinobacterium TaxID=2644139 RepID=UPI00156850B6|nr:MULTISPECIES: LPS-assembly protein LptD [unclassified Marinobacterium]NRP57395.1 LPS-assembly protein LptD precursor [Marinobacterium sp. xm-d-510]NRP97907.1 LPS-assembly protein LptD precursor [Marinobacterium sp. xm-a-127]